MSLLDSASSGDRLQALMKLRDVLAQQIDVADKPADVSSLSRQFRDTLAEIDKLNAGVKQEGSVLDELSKRRSARRAAATG